MARPLHLAWALVLGACFTGGFFAGQPCTSDADCGPTLRCQGGVCGGAPAGQSSSSSSSTSPTTGEPTTTATSTSTSTSTEASSSTGTPTTSTGAPTTSTGEPTTDATTGPGCGLGRCADIDLLFVIDNSPSMSDDFDNLISSLGPFTQTVLPGLKQACSVHLGVVTTDAFPYNPLECRQLGALVRADNTGAPCSFAEGLPYATLEDLDDPTSLSCILTVGSDGDGDEKPIDAILSALDPDLNEACNAGFYRKDAFLAVILATDEDDDNGDAQGHDGSGIVPTNLWLPTLSAYKDRGVDDMYLVAFLGDEDPNMQNCSWMPLALDDGLGSEHAPVLRSFVQSFPAEHHAIGSLCKTPDPANYEALMQEILAEIQTVCGA